MFPSDWRCPCLVAHMHPSFSYCKCDEFNIYPAQNHAILPSPSHRKVGTAAHNRGLKTELPRCFKSTPRRTERYHRAQRRFDRIWVRSDMECDSLFLLRVYWGIKWRAVKHKKRASRFVCFPLRFFFPSSVLMMNTVWHIQMSDWLQPLRIKQQKAGNKELK